MKNWTITHRVLTGFCIISLLTVIVGLIGYLSLRTIRNDATMVLDDSVPATITLTQIECRLAEEYGYMERCLRANDAAERDALIASIEKVEKETDELRTRFANTALRPADREFLNLLAEPRRRFQEAKSQLITFSKDEDRTNAYAFITQEYIPAYNTYKQLLNEHVNEYNTLTDRAGREVMKTIRSATDLILFVVLAALVIAPTIAFCTIRSTCKVLNHVIDTLEEGSNEVAAAAVQVSSASSSLAEGASEQAASLEETSSSLEEMSSMTAQNNVSAGKARELAEEMHSAANTSATQMKEMQKAMDAIKESSAGISQIIKTIDEIAFQTNILALNAAVEAARAGDAGAGFAVVAEEVRNLAQRSAESAKETSSKIEGAIRNSDYGVSISAKVADSLEGITEKAHEINTLVNEIAAASGEQDKGISQLSSAVMDMDKVTQTNASDAEETAAAAEELNSNAASLKDTVSELASLIRSSNKAAPAAGSFAKVATPHTMKLNKGRFSDASFGGKRLLTAASAD